jgi:hypothetical protein
LSSLCSRVRPRQAVSQEDGGAAVWPPGFWSAPEVPPQRFFQLRPGAPVVPPQQFFLVRPPGFCSAVTSSPAPGAHGATSTSAERRPVAQQADTATAHVTQASDVASTAWWSAIVGKSAPTSSIVAAGARAAKEARPTEIASSVATSSVEAMRINEAAQGANAACKAKAAQGPTSPNEAVTAKKTKCVRGTPMRPNVALLSLWKDNNA